MSFQIGDRVRLKSGGPTMTVENVGKAGMTGEDTVWVSWFDARGQRQQDTFAPGALEADNREAHSVGVVDSPGPKMTDKLRRLFGNRGR